MSETIKQRIIKALEESAPATSYDIAQELGMPLRTVSAHLCYWRSAGLFEVVGTLPGVARAANLWDFKK